MRKHRFSLVVIIVLLLIVVLPVTLAIAVPQTGTGALKRMWLPALGGALPAVIVGIAVQRRSSH